MPQNAKKETLRNQRLVLQSILFRISGTRTLIFRRGDVKAVAYGQGDTARIVVFHLLEHHTVAVERETVDAAVEEVVSRELDIKAAMEKILADAQ